MMTVTDQLGRVLVAGSRRYWIKRWWWWYLRQDGSETGDFPTVRGEASKVDHASDHGNHDQVHPLEALPDLGEFGEEVGVVLLLGCSSPAHIDAEHVRADGKEDVERDTTEEDHEEGHPLEVLEKGTNQTGLTDTVAHNGEADV